MNLFGRNWAARRRDRAPEFGLYASLAPGAGAHGSGGRLGDALALALGTVFVAGWALLAVEGVVAVARNVGAATHGG